VDLGKTLEMDRKRERLQRRRVERVLTSGSVLVHCNGATVHARIDDLSCHGVRVHAEPGAEASGVCERISCDLEVRLDGFLGTWFWLRGHVHWIDRCHRWIAVELEAVPDGFDALLAQEARAATEGERVPRVVLLDRDLDRRSRLACALRVAGCEVAEATAPLEVIVDLDDSRLHARRVLVADTVPVRDVQHLRTFLSESYPAVELAAFGRELERFDDLSELANRVACALRRP